MKAVFVHDNRFIPHNDKVYSDVQFPSSVWDRYLEVFDSLVVIGREGKFPPNKGTENYVVSSAHKVSFVFAPDMSSISAQLIQRRKTCDILRTYIKDADVVIARLQSELGLLAVRTARLEHKVYAVEVVACPLDALWNYGSLKAKIYAPIMAWRTRQAVGSAPFALYVTKKFLQGRYPNKKGVSISCSNVVIPPPQKDILEKRKAKIDANRSPVVLGLIGTLRTRYKGIQTVLKALQMVRRNLPQIQFRVLGDGDSSQWVEEARKLGVDDIVKFDGILPPGNPVLEWLDEVDIYLQPSFHEGLPRALIEAMSRGCPALASTCAGIPELLDESSLFKPGDVKRLGYLLVSYIKNIEWKKEQAEKNWNTAHDYSKDILETRRKTFWEAAASSSRIKNLDTDKYSHR